MENKNLYIVVSTDRHRDDIFTLFKTKDKAIDFAKREFKSLVGHIKNINIPEFLALIESNQYASFLDGNYKVSIEKTNYPI